MNKKHIQVGIIALILLCLLVSFNENIENVIVYQGSTLPEKPITNAPQKFMPGDDLFLFTKSRCDPSFCMKGGSTYSCDKGCVELTDDDLKILRG